MRTRTQGMTVVELLVVMAVMGVILTLLTVFFASQARTSSRTQATNEVEVKVRTAAEIITQDLQVTGSRIVVDNTVNPPSVQNVSLPCDLLKGSVNHCVKTTEAGSLLTLYYATSLRDASVACRRVDYGLADGVLTRSDQGCGEAVDFQPFAEGITALSIEFLCENGTAWISDPAGCYGAGDSFPQQARISIEGTSENTRENRDTTVTLSTTMPNLRPIAIAEEPGG